MPDPYIGTPIDRKIDADDPVKVSFFASDGHEWNMWDAAHNANPQVREEFDLVARAYTRSIDWCKALFGTEEFPEPHEEYPYDHEHREWSAQAIATFDMMSASMEQFTRGMDSNSKLYGNLMMKSLPRLSPTNRRIKEKEMINGLLDVVGELPSGPTASTG